MVTRITLGNVVNNGGQTRITGSQSQLDTDAIVKSLVEARRQPAVRLEDKNKALDEQSKALGQMQSILKRFQSAVDTLRNPPGVGNASKNIFQYRNATLSATNGFAAANYVSVAAQPGAAVQSFNITEINQLARETRQETAVFSLPDTTTASVVTAAPTAGSFTAGTFTVRNVLGGAAATVTLNTGDSLQTVATRFNEVSDRTGIRANIIKVANGSPNSDYKIIFTATKPGTTYGFNLNNPATILSDPGGVLANVVIPPPTQTAQNAQFEVDGISITRESNTVNDVFSGLTFTLKQQTVGATDINVNIAPDTQIVQNALTSFADVYNEFRLFAAKQTELGEDGLPTEEAVLANNSTLRSVISRIGAQVSGVVDGISGGNPSRLADVGLEFSDFEGDEENPFTRNILTIDTDKLASALSANFDGVRGLFEFQMQSDNSALAIFKRTNGLNVSNFTLNINRSTETYTASYTDPTLGPQVINLTGTPIGVAGGITLKGQAGTVLEGMELIFASSANATVNVTATQGLGDRAFNALEDILDDQDGFLTTALQTIEDQKKRNEEEITRIDTQMVTYRQQLESQYSALEEALSKANSLLTLLDAQANARNNS